MIGDSQYMYGFARRSPYAVYVTDLSNLWLDEPSEEKVQKLALSEGISDFDASKYDLLLSQLETAFNDAQKLEFSAPSDGPITIKAPLSSELVWNFELVKADEKVTSLFFSQVFTHSLSNHNYLLFRIAKLESMIRTRDNYMLYLEENYKTVNGTELIDKYRRQRPDDAKLLTRYDSDATKLDTSSSFRNLMLKNTDADLHQLLWRIVSAAVDDEHTWKSSIANPEKDVVAETVPSVIKRERDTASDSITLKRIKLEPLEQVPKIKQKSTSPRRKRIGIVRR